MMGLTTAEANAGGYGVADVEPFTTNVHKEQLDDLRRRLASARWPERETVRDFSQGLQLSRLKRLVAYWQAEYDWRRCEAMLNAFGQYQTEIDGLNIHFLHVRSRHEGALPLLLTHGWPGSVLEFSKVIGPLTDPVAHGGKHSDAFHVIVPSIGTTGLGTAGLGSLPSQSASTLQMTTSPSTATQAETSCSGDLAAPPVNPSTVTAQSLSGGVPDPAQSLGGSATDAAQRLGGTARVPAMPVPCPTTSTMP